MLSPRTAPAHCDSAVYLLRNYRNCAPSPCRESAVPAGKGWREKTGNCLRFAVVPAGKSRLEKNAIAFFDMSNLVEMRQLKIHQDLRLIYSKNSDEFFSSSWF
jgi:hypothetical protein